MTTSNTSKFKQALDTTVSICLICVSIAIVLVAVRYWRDSRSQAATQNNNPAYNTLQKGEVLQLSSIRKHDPAGNLLLLSLQSGCHFCRESLPLYRKLVAQSSQFNAKIVFVFQEPLASASSYLQSNGLSGVDLQQADFNSIHVAGTPTLILVDGSNHVTDYWVGKLPDSGIAKLYKKLEARN